jgi:hypothetical protein
MITKVQYGGYLNINKLFIVNFPGLNKISSKYIPKFSTMRIKQPKNVFLAVSESYHIKPLSINLTPECLSKIQT